MATFSGAGDTLSAAIAALLALGLELGDAVREETISSRRLWLRATGRPRTRRTDRMSGRERMRRRPKTQPQPRQQNHRRPRWRRHHRHLHRERGRSKMRAYSQRCRCARGASSLHRVYLVSPIGTIRIVFWHMFRRPLSAGVASVQYRTKPLIRDCTGTGAGVRALTRTGGAC